MEEIMIKQKIPATDSIQELARFWDNHDITDFDEALEEIAEPVFMKERDIHLHLNQEEMQSLERLARQRELKKDELIREWVLEKLRVA
jgi:hypothetical protein